MTGENRRDGYSEGVEPVRITTEEALATVEMVDGEPTVEGVPVPPDVFGDENVARFANAVRQAREFLGLPATSGPAMMLARTMYNDPVAYPS